MVALVVLQPGIGMPDMQGRQLRAVGLECIEHRAQLLEGDFPAALRLIEVDGQRIQLVAVCFQPGGEVLGLLAGDLSIVGLPAGMQQLVQGVVVDDLLVLAADAVDQLDQFAVEHLGRILDQLGLGLIAQRLAGIAALGQAAQLQGAGLDPVGVDGVKQLGDDMAEWLAAGMGFQLLVFGRLQLLGQPCQPPCQGADGIAVTGAEHHAHRQILEGYAGLGDQRLASGLQRLGDADGIDDDVVGLGGLRCRGDLL
ncbi:hypothetical protein D9M71_466540 [compost metagenome]